MRINNEDRHIIVRYALLTVQSVKMDRDLENGNDLQKILGKYHFDDRLAEFLAYICLPPGLKLVRTQ